MARERSPRRTTYRARRALRDLRADFAFLVVFLWINAVVLAVVGAAAWRTPSGPLWLAASIGLGALAVGLRRGRAWARWPAFGLCASAFAAGLLQGASEGWSWDVLTPLACGVEAIALALPSTGASLRAIAEDETPSAPNA